MNKKLITFLLSLLLLFAVVPTTAFAAPHVTHAKPAWMGNNDYVPRTATAQADCYGTHAATTVVWDSTKTRFFDMGNFCISDNYGFRLVGQEDGNLVMYADIWNQDFPQWASNTEYIGRYVGLSKAGDINVYDVNGALIWSNWAHMHIIHRATSKVYKISIEIVGPSSQAPYCHLDHYVATEQFFKYDHHPKYWDYQFPSLLTAKQGVESAGTCDFKIYR